MATADRVLETSTTTGTGTFTLDGAVAGYQTFNSGISVSDTCEYTIEAVDGNGVPTGEWEVGTGTLATATTLQRDTVLDSSNAGAAVNFSAGTKNVFITQAADLIDPDIAANTITGNPTGSAAPESAMASSDITTEATPAAGMFAVGYLATGELRKYDVAAFLGGGGGTPGGNDSEIQYNSSNTFAGASNITVAANGNLFLTAPSATDPAGVARAAVSQTAPTFEFQASDGTPGARITANQEFSNPGGGSGLNNQLFGVNLAAALTTGHSNTFVGTDITVNATATLQCVGVGFNISLTGRNGTVVGYSNTVSINDATICGRGWSMTAGSGSVAVGSGGAGQNVAAGRGMWGSPAVPVSLVVSELSGDPAAFASGGTFYSKDVAGTIEAFAMNSAGTATQLTSHDSDGYWYHKSRIPQRDTTLTIHVEKLIRHLAARMPELDLAQFIEES